MSAETHLSEVQLVAPMARQAHIVDPSDVRVVRQPVRDLLRVCLLLLYPQGHRLDAPQAQERLQGSQPDTEGVLMEVDVVSKAGKERHITVDEVRVQQKFSSRRNALLKAAVTSIAAKSNNTDDQRVFIIITEAPDGVQLTIKVDLAEVTDVSRAAGRVHGSTSLNMLKVPNTTSFPWYYSGVERLPMEADVSSTDRRSSDVLFSC